MIFTFTKMQKSVKRTGMIDAVYYEDTLSVNKGAPEWWVPPRSYICFLRHRLFGSCCGDIDINRAFFAFTWPRPYVVVRCFV